MLTINLGLVSEVEGHDPSDVARVAAALQKQATRDFGPIWDVSATVDAFPRLEDVPVGYWPMIVETDINTPRFFEPRRADGCRYSFTGALTKPREILRGGYISWHEPVSNHWWQQIWFGEKKEFRDLGVFDATAGSLRAWVDAKTDHPGIDQGLPPGNPTLTAAVAVGEETSESANAKASAWREQIAAIKKPSN